MGEQHPQPNSDPNAYMDQFEGQTGTRLTPDNAEAFPYGFNEVQSTFNSAASASENLAAVVAMRAQHGDKSMINNAGYLLGALARIEELQRGQQ
jgi:hypothetical protein